MAQSERPPAADEIEIFLQRAAPGAVEREEIVAETGMDTDDLRDGLAYLTEEGSIRETKDGFFQVADGDEPPATASDEEDAAAPTLADDDDPAGPALTGAQLRANFEVICTFGQDPGASDKAALLKTEAIRNEIGNALGAALPKLDFHVEVTAVDAFTARPLWPPPETDEAG
jgi:hypothetical protein